MKFYLININESIKNFFPLLFIVTTKKKGEKVRHFIFLQLLTADEHSWIKMS